VPFLHAKPTYEDVIQRAQRVTAHATFQQLDRAAALLNVAAEGMGQVDGAWRAYLAVPKILSVEQVLNALGHT